MKIVFVIISAFMISFLILSLSLFFYHYTLQDGKWIIKGDDMQTRQKAFYSQNFPVNQKKIFLIGSSQIQALNPSFMQEDLLKNNQSGYIIYNLSVGADLPKSRLKTVDWIISAKPTMVVYGISDRDFSIIGSTTSDENLKNLLPDPHNLIGDWLHTQLLNSKYDFYFLESPKLDFLTLIFGSNYTQRNIIHEFIPDPQKHTRFLETNNWPIANDTTLETQSGNSFFRFIKILPLEENENLIAFKKIIGILHENKIPVVIFVVPQERHRLDKVQHVEQFNLALKNISQEYPDVPIHSLWDKYADLNVWQDVGHVVMNSKNTTRIYSDDVAKFIIDDLSSKKKVDVLGKDLIPVGNEKIIPTTPSKSSIYIGTLLNFTEKKYIKTSNSSLYNFTSSTPFSIAFWIKMPLTHISVDIVSKTIGSHGPGWNIWSYSKGKLVFTMGDGKNFSEVSSTISIDDNLWHHVVCTYDGSKNQYGMKIYVDGALNNQGTKKSLTYFMSNNQSLSLGSNANGAQTVPTGTLIDDLRIYNIDISKQQIHDLFLHLPVLNKTTSASFTSVKNK